MNSPTWATEDKSDASEQNDVNGDPNLTFIPLLALSFMVINSPRTPFQRVHHHLHTFTMANRQSLLSKALQDDRPASSPPSVAHSPIRGSPLSNYHQHHARSSSIPRTAETHPIPSRNGTGTPPLYKDAHAAKSLDLINLLERSEPSVVKTRNGSVLSRGFILKTDHYPSGMSFSL